MRFPKTKTLIVEVVHNYTDESMFFTLDIPDSFHLKDVWTAKDESEESSNE